MTPQGDAQGKYLLPKIGEKQFTTYIETVNYLLKSFATNSNIAKATFEDRVAQESILWKLRPVW